MKPGPGSDSLHTPLSPPTTGARIETPTFAAWLEGVGRPLPRGRGLKPKRLMERIKTWESPPTTGARIETSPRVAPSMSLLSPPTTGARIETRRSSPGRARTCVAPYHGGAD